ncbi:MAG: OadG family protein [Lentisphaeria bacterium]|nr:OadG family protein [Lentisphaeria bacterium]
MGQMLLDGLKAMVLGMGMVYIFLIVMIFCMKLMSKLLEPYKNALVKAAPGAAKKPAAKKAAGGLSEQDKLLAKAAIEAVKMHRGGK